MQIRQAAILCGGLGTRLGALTAQCPKPLLPVAGRPFLELLVDELVRQGIGRVLLLAAFESEQVRAFAAGLAEKLEWPLEVEVSIEPERAGTGGALWHAREKLDEVFFLLNGDSWLDIPLARLSEALLAPGAAGEAEPLGALALRALEDTGRYGVVEIEGARVRAFAERPPVPGPGTVNGGVYLFRRALVEALPEKGSLEGEVLPKLAAAGLLRAAVSEGYFIDIGIPADYARAQYEIPARRRRPAVFLDRDGVLNHDHGYVGQIERFQWMDGAKDAVRRINDAGFYAFIVTNQAGIAKGHFEEADYFRLRAHMRAELAEAGAHIDDERFCPYHVDGTVERYRRASSWRKPEPGAIRDLMRRWPVEMARSFLIGDQPTDLAAAKAAGLPSYAFAGGNLDAFLRPLLDARRAPVLPEPAAPTSETSLMEQERQRLLAWLFDTSLPLWSTVGVDTEGWGFFEKLTPQGVPTDDPRRARVVGRQIFSFATAVRLGWQGDGRALVRRGLDALEAHYFAPNGQVYSVVGRDGTVLVPGFDLYDHAFVLFGLAAAHAIGERKDAVKARAKALLEATRAGFSHPVAGFEESQPRTLPLKANPHMHIFEASLAWAATDDDPLWMTQADAIAELCLARFLDPKTGALREFFDGDWNLINSHEDAVVEPGHQFEWAWLLMRWGRMRERPDAIAAARRLIAIAQNEGVDPARDLAINELNPDLTVRDDRARLWPQTERIKAFVTLSTLAATDEEHARDEANVAAAARGLMRFFDHPVKGAWWEHIGRDGVPLVEPSRASSLYHIMCATDVMCAG